MKATILAVIATVALVAQPVAAQPKPMLPMFGAAPVAGTWTNTELYPRTAADSNGDGKADIIGFANDGVYVALSASNAFRPATRWVAAFGTNAGNWTGSDKYPRTAADVNGDGKADIVGFANDGVYVSLSDGKLFNAPTKWRAGDFSTGGGWTGQSIAPRFAADVNNDGKADIIGVASDGVYVSLSTGSAFGVPSKWSASFNPPNWTNMNQVPRTVADVNGDGRADFIGFALDGVYVALSSGTAFAAPSKWSAGFGGNASWTSFDSYPRWAADVNGDRKADIVGFSGEGMYVALSGVNTFAAPQQWTTYYSQNSGGWTSQATLPRMVADFNGDGKHDVIGFAYEGVHGSMSTGTAFATPAAGVPSDLESSLLASVELMQRVAVIYGAGASATSAQTAVSQAMAQTGTLATLLQLVPPTSTASTLSARDQELLDQYIQTRRQAADSMGSASSTLLPNLSTLLASREDMLASIRQMLEQAQRVRATVIANLQ